MTEKEKISCIQTIELLRRLAFNVHGVMDVIDAQNCVKIIEMIKADKPSQNIERIAKFNKSIDAGLEEDAKRGELNPALDMTKYTALTMLCLKEMNNTLAYLADTLMGIAKMMPEQEVKDASTQE